MNEHIMISYNWSSSGELAHKINDALKKNNYRTWIDVEEMNGNIDATMANAVENSFLVLVLVTKNYCNSVNCTKECLYANNLKKPIIPIQVSFDCVPNNVQGKLKAVITHLPYCDFSIQDFDTSMERLLAEIGKFKRPNKYEIEYRFCLHICENESIFYAGKKTWYHCKDEEILGPFIEERRDDEGIVILYNDESIRLSDLMETTLQPQPRWKNTMWSKVWKKRNLDQYFYPQNNEIWIELQNNQLFGKHQLVKIDNEAYYFRKVDTDWYFKLDYFNVFCGDNVNDLSFQICEGSWIN